MMKLLVCTFFFLLYLLSYTYLLPLRIYLLFLLPFSLVVLCKYSKRITLIKFLLTTKSTLVSLHPLYTLFTYPFYRIFTSKQNVKYSARPKCVLLALYRVAVALITQKKDLLPPCRRIFILVTCS